MVKVLISGAGPAGLLLAQHLIRRPGYQVHLLEQRINPAVPSGERSYPMAIQPRGMRALEEIPGLTNRLESVGEWLEGVALHSVKPGKKPRVIQRPNNFSIRRSDLVKTMWEHLEEDSKEIHPSSSFQCSFECGVQDVFMHNQTVLTSTGKAETFDYLIAADGANSAVRESLAKDPQNDLQVQQVLIEDSYRSLVLQTTSPDQSFQLEKIYMHGWQMDDQRVLTIPLLNDGTSIGVYIFPSEKDPFKDMKSPQELLDFWKIKCPAMVPLVTLEEAQEFLQRPSSSTWVVKCNRLTVGSKVVLLGDAAHALSASLGQGCNSALQDVQILNQCLKENKEDWPQTLQQFNKKRLPEVHAVQEMSEYANPRTRFMRIEFLVRILLKVVLPKWLSKRVLKPMPMDAMHNPDKPYTEMLAETRWWSDRVKRSFKVKLF